MGFVRAAGKNLRLFAYDGVERVRGIKSMGWKELYRPVVVRIVLGCSLTAFLIVSAWSADITTPTTPPTTEPAEPKLQSSDVIFYQHFDNSRVGPYKTLHGDWKHLSEVTPGGGQFSQRLTIVEGPEAFKGRSMRLLCPKGTASGPMAGGACWFVDLGKGNQEMYCSYMVKFNSKFEFSQGGKLPGLSGGVFPSPGKGAQQNGWCAVILWNAGWRHSISNYVYHLDQKDKYGDFFWWDNKGKTVAFQPGVWMHVETHVKMNSAPDKHDGIIQDWANGQLVLDRQDVRWRNTNSVGVDKFVFTVFFGGSGPGYESKKDEYIYFDNFVISRKRAGPPPAFRGQESTLTAGKADN